MLKLESDGIRGNCHAVWFVLNEKLPKSSSHLMPIELEKVTL